MPSTCHPAYPGMSHDRHLTIYVAQLQAPQHGVSGDGATAETTWRDLPTCVAARIVRTALQDSGGGLVLWLRLSTVCRCFDASETY